MYIQPNLYYLRYGLVMSTYFIYKNNSERFPSANGTFCFESSRNLLIVKQIVLITENKGPTRNIPDENCCGFEQPTTWPTN